MVYCSGGYDRHDERQAPEDLLAYRAYTQELPASLQESDKHSVQFSSSYAFHPKKDGYAILLGKILSKKTFYFLIFSGARDYVREEACTHHIQGFSIWSLKYEIPSVFLVVVHQKVAVTAKPNQVGHIVVSSILVFVMYNKRKFIGQETASTLHFCRRFPENCSIRSFAIFPVGVTRACCARITPHQRTFFATEKSFLF